MAVGEKRYSCAGLGVERETTVDQTLIRGLITAFRGVLFYAGVTSRPMAHRNAAISRAIAATTTGSFLPVAARTGA
jgi:hypothetical protein